MPLVMMIAEFSSNLSKTPRQYTHLCPESFACCYRDFLPPFQSQQTKMKALEIPPSRVTRKSVSWNSMVSGGVYQELRNKELRLLQNFEKLRLLHYPS
jgi:hypothetical protein